MSGATIGVKAGDIMCCMGAKTGAGSENSSAGSGTVAENACKPLLAAAGDSGL